MYVMDPICLHATTVFQIVVGLQLWNKIIQTQHPHNPEQHKVTFLKRYLRENAAFEGIIKTLQTISFVSKTIDFKTNWLNPKLVVVGQHQQ